MRACPRHNRFASTPAMAAAVLAVFGLGVLPGSAAAQDVPLWRSWAGHERQWLDSDRPEWSDWQWWEAGVQRSFDAGTLSGRGVRARRFGRWENALALDGYIELGGGWYTHAGVQASPEAEVLPSSDVRLELMGSLAGGWEPMVGVRRLEFGEAIPMVSAGMGRYLPGWYLRARIDVAEPLSDAAPFVTASARRYLEGVEGFVEAGAGAGREVVEVAAGPVVATRPSRAAWLRSELFPARRYGGSLAVSYSALEELPSRLGLSASLILRW